MENKVRGILADINEDILSYKGKNLLEDKVVDSFDIMEIVANIEEAFNIELAPELVTSDNFATIDTIINMVRISIQGSEK